MSENPNNIIVGDLMTVSEFGQMLAQAQAIWNEKHPPTVAQRKAAERVMFEKWYAVTYPQSYWDENSKWVENTLWQGWWARANDGEIPDEA